MPRAEPRIPSRAGTGLTAPAEAFSLRAVTASPASCVSATGKLTGETAASCLATVLRCERTRGCHFVRLDLTEVSMLDRAGFDVLVDAHQQFLVAGGALVMTGVGPRIARLLELTGLDRTLFTVARSGDVLPLGLLSNQVSDTR